MLPIGSLRAVPPRNHVDYGALRLVVLVPCHSQHPAQEEFFCQSSLVSFAVRWLCIP